MHYMLTLCVYIYIYSHKILKISYMFRYFLDHFQGVFYIN